MAELATDPRSTRASLLRRVRDLDDHESWREFFDTYWKLIFDVSLKAGLSQSEAQDVVQETILSVCRKMPDFCYDPAKGSFKSWLLNLTRWRIIDRFRKRSPAYDSLHKDTKRSERTSTVERIPDLAAGSRLDDIWNAEWQRNLLDVAVKRLKSKVRPKQFQAFELFVLKRLPVTQVAKTLKINPAQVYLIKHRVTLLLKRELVALERRAAETGRDL